MRMNTPIRLLILALAWLHLTAAWPQSAHYTSQTDEMIWFLAITDSHIGQGMLGANQDSDNLRWALGELYQTVQPSFLVNSGDLVDATGGGAVPLGQFDKEWEEYYQLITEAGMTSDKYFDLPGNHDNYAEWPMVHYLTSSVQGKANNRLNHSWIRNDAKGNKYLFIGLATNGNDKSLWLDDPGLDSTDRAYAEQAFSDHSDADIAFMIGHHPVGNLEEGADSLVGWFLEHAVSGYVFGHSHDYSMGWDDGTFQVNIRSTAKNDDKQIGLFAFDGMGLSARVFDVGAWPQVLVTTPVDSAMGGNNPYDYMIPDSLTDARVRALAFHPDGVASVVALLDNSLEIPMQVVEDNIWEAAFDASQLDDEGPHTLKVTATAWGNTSQHTVTFYVFHDETPPDPVEPSPESEDLGPADSSPEQGEFDVIEEVMEPAEEDHEVVTQDDLDNDLPNQDLASADLLLPDLSSVDQASELTPLPDQLDPIDSVTPKDGTQPSSDVVTSSDQLAGDALADSLDSDSPGSLKGGGCASSSPVPASGMGLFLAACLLLFVLRRRAPAA